MELHKFWFIFIFAICISLSAVSANALLTTNILSALRFENTSLIDEGTRGYTWTNMSLTRLNSTGGINNNYLWGTGYLNATNNGTLLRDLNTSLVNGYTCNVWIYDDLTATGWIYGWSYDANYRGEMAVMTNGSVYMYNNPSAVVTYTAKKVQPKSWNMISFKWNGTLSVYINSTKDTVTQVAYDRLGIYHLNSLLRFKGDQNGANGVDGFDEWTCWNQSLTDAEIVSLWNGALRFYPFVAGGSAGTITLNWTAPTNNTQYSSSSILFNYTINQTNTSSLVSCSLVNNGTANITTTGLNASNQSYQFWINYSATQTQIFNYSINCSCVGCTNATSDFRTIYVDNVAPVFTTSISGNDYWIWSNETLYFNINATDTYLYYINITDTGGYYNFTNLSTLGVSTYWWNGSINLSGRNANRYNVTIKVCDGHTSSFIDSFDYKKDSLTKTLTYNFGKDYIKIYPENSLIFSAVDTQKQIDRYSFEYTLPIPQKIAPYSFFVESSQRIDYLSRGEYDGWLTIPSLDKWIDFETKDNEGFDYKVELISKNKAKVTITGIEKSDIVFNSIGSLNCVNSNYFYSKVGFDETHEATVLEGDTAHFSLNVTWYNQKSTSVTFPPVVTYNKIINLTLAKLNWNGTNYSAFKMSSGNYSTSNCDASGVGATITCYLAWEYFEYNKTVGLSSNQNVSALWYLNFTNSYVKGDFTSGAYNQVNNLTQEIYTMSLTDCSAPYNTTALNFSFYNETTNTTMNASAESTFTLRSGAVIRNLSLISQNTADFLVCLNPPNETILTNATIAYNKTDYPTRNYFLVNANLTNVTQYVTLYLIDAASSTSVYINAKDTVGSAYKNVIFKVLRYFIGTNEMRLVEESKSGEEGNAPIRLVETSVNYKFIGELDGVVVFSSDLMRIVCTSTPCAIQFTIPPANIGNSNPYTAINGFSNFFTWDNETKIASLVYNDVTGVTPTLRFLVKKDSTRGVLTICNSTATSASGSISCNLSSYPEGTAYLYAYRTASPESLIGWLAITLDSFIDIFGTEGVFWAWILILTAVIVGMIWEAGLGIFGLFLGLLFIYFLKIMSISYLLVIIAAFVLIIISALIRRRGIYE